MIIRYNYNILLIKSHYYLDLPRYKKIKDSILKNIGNAIKTQMLFHNPKSKEKVSIGFQLCIDYPINSSLLSFKGIFHWTQILQPTYPIHKQ
ncbi:unnamed protein product [Paramecium primaurelia]|uniref:Uncharacterized protein n=1 Tax=Paramecium primaurelia TaxID=5886 RepID=A0A8S1M8Q7_PARPR|nr:unnamed protein product [Paramecium primaurelia]